MLQISYIHEVTGDSSGGGHCRADQVSAPAVPLASLKVAIAGRGTTLTLFQVIAIHSDAHTASRFAPLEASLAENVGQPLLFSHTPHSHRAGHNQRPHRWCHVLAPDVLRRH